MQFERGEVTHRDKSLLQLPVDLRLVPATGAFVGRYATELGLTGIQAQQLEEAVKASLESLMARRGVEQLTVHVESCAHEFRLRIVDQGIPSSDVFSALHPEGLRAFLSQYNLDTVDFHYLGKEGNETVLTWSFQKPPVARIRPESEKMEVPADLKYSVRRMKAEEAIEVARCIYTAYGYSYPVEAVYLPQRLSGMNKSAEMISAVAEVDERGPIFATMSLEPGFGPGLRDVGLAATYPEFQGQGAARRLFSFLIEEAQRDGVQGVTGWAVTQHVYSQKLVGHEMRPSALLVGNAPDSFHFKGMKDSGQRGSVVGYYRDLGRTGEIPISVPERHRDVVGTLFDRFGWTPQFVQHQESDRLEHSELTVRGNQERQGAILILKQAGKDARKALDDAHRRLTETGTVEFLVVLDIGDPGTAELANYLETQSHYFFCGIMPRTFGGHALLLQCLHTDPLDYNAIKLHSDEAKVLRDYVKHCDPHQT
jgi:GNAT superfamily N-acetyltransferase